MRFLTQLAIFATSISAFEVQHPLTQEPIVGDAKKHLEFPPLGFGTWQLNPENSTAAVASAIKAGYRHIDGAAIYRNEKAVGEGIRKGLEEVGLKREEVWITSKLWNDDHGNETQASTALNKTLSDLGLEYLDLYLMHWPVGHKEGDAPAPFDYVSTWNSLAALPKSLVRNIGVCNFAPAQLAELIAKTGVKPFAHQMEMHPYLPQSSYVASHKLLGIEVTAYSPLAHAPNDGVFPPPLIRNDVLVEIGKKVGCTPAQVALKWGLVRGTGVIPKSSHEVYIKENFEAQKCELGEEEMKAIDGLGEKFLTRFINPSKQWGVKLFEGLEDS